MPSRARGHPQLVRTQEEHMKAATASTPNGPARGTVSGGSWFIRTVELAMVWWAYRERLIELRDFRVWCVCRLERAARRGQDAHYSVRQLARRAKVGESSLRGSLR